MKGYQTATPLFDLKPPAPPAPPVDPHVRSEDAPRLARKNMAVLRRLQEGPATTLELMGPSFGIRPGARVFDLCAAGCRIKSERVENGVALYRLLECPEGLS